MSYAPNWLEIVSNKRPSGRNASVNAPPGMCKTSRIPFSSRWLQSKTRTTRSAFVPRQGTTTRLPRGVQSALTSGSPCAASPFSINSSAPVSISRNQTLRDMSETASTRQSAENESRCRTRVGSRHDASDCQVPVSQTRTVPSPPPEANRRPSGAKARQFTVLSCPVRVSQFRSRLCAQSQRHSKPRKSFCPGLGTWAFR